MISEVCNATWMGTKWKNCGILVEGLALVHQTKPNKISCSSPNATEVGV